MTTKTMVAPVMKADYTLYVPSGVSPVEVAHSFLFSYLESDKAGLLAPAFVELSDLANLGPGQTLNLTEVEMEEIIDQCWEQVAEEFNIIMNTIEVERMGL